MQDSNNNSFESVSNQSNTTEALSGQTPTATFEPIDLTKWSWGGFFHPWFAMVASRQYVYLLLYVLYFIPIINFFAWIGLHVYFGLKGREFISNHKQAFANEAETAGFIRGYDRAGKFSALLILIGLIVAGVLVAVLSTTVLSSLNTARTAGEDARTKSIINSARAAAELYYVENGDLGYQGYCDSPDFRNNVSAELNNTECRDNVNGWVVIADLTETDLVYCADYTGYAREVSRLDVGDLSCLATPAPNQNPYDEVTEIESEINSQPSFLY